MRRNANGSLTKVRENEVKGSWGRKPHIEETMCSDYNGSIDLHLAVSERG